VSAERPLDLVCVSYLADAQVLRVAAYPRANGGAVVDATAASIAGDGPLAAIATGLGLSVGLIANGVGTDPAGRRLVEWLEAVGIRHASRQMSGVCTPQLMVIADDAGTRTWFACLQHAYDELRVADLSLLAEARLAYVDCYQALTTAVARTVAAADGTPLLLNFGGNPLHDEIVAAADGQHVVAVQTSLDESSAEHAAELASMLFDRLRPDAAVVTLGRLGALARTRAGIHRADAPADATDGVIAHIHGAGAAFSAGYGHTVLTGATTEAALRQGCRAGTAYCTGPAAVVPRHLPTALFATA
jgi:sugar/nucleoside kinase (ribokinase family)